MKGFGNNDKITKDSIIKKRTLQKDKLISDAISLQSNGKLKEKTFMFTGKLDGISRAEAKSVIELNSGSIVSNVSKKLDYLIIGEKPTKKKIDMAKELKIKIISQEEWNKMLNKI